jgi:sigma-B regulation protein RsbU (phosphoserine phosphatase)
MFEEASYETLECPLEPGDRHVLYTDGIVEAASPAAELYGEDRFMRFIENNQALNAEQFADVFLADVTQWGQSAGQGQQDDITLLLFDFKRF